MRAPFVQMTLVACKLSRFRDVSDEFKKLLDTPPTPRFLPKLADPREKRPADITVPDDGEPAALKSQYGGWPPASWQVAPLSTATYIDAATPVLANELNFPAPTTVNPDVDTVVLELQAAISPTIFGVTWSKSIKPKAGAAAPSYLLYLRQTTGQNVLHDGMFEGKLIPSAYPRNFDYAERCLFESMHYGKTPLMQQTGAGVLAFALRPKGAPYQVAKSGVPIVTVYPVARAYQEFRGLNPTNLIEGILEEVQAFMFWRAGVPDPPPTIGKTAISTFSSSNYTLQSWLEDYPGNLTGHFLSQVVTALYLFDPPDPEGMTHAALTWTKVAGSKKRMRFYGRGMDKDHPEISPIHEKLMGWKSKGHPVTPFVTTTTDGKHTVALLPFSAWQRAFTKLGMTGSVATWDAHHLIPATMLTHALKQGDL